LTIQSLDTGRSFIYGQSWDLCVNMSEIRCKLKRYSLP